MLIIFQAPFADLRDFVSTNTYKLNKPNWLIVNPYLGDDFINRFGLIEKTRLKNIDWTISDAYCRAKNAFTFDKSQMEELSRSGHGMIVHSRRFFPSEIMELRKDADGSRKPYQKNVICSVEIGFIHTTLKKFKKHPLSANDLNNLIKRCLKLNVSINLPNIKKAHHSLYKISRYVNKIYLNATTKRAHIDHCCKWWVTSGAPMVVVEYNSFEVKQLPASARLIKHIKDQNIKIFFDDLILDGKYPLKAWYIQTNRLTKQCDVKNLVEGLMHINASQQCLNMVLRNYNKIHLEKGTTAYNKFQEYLDFTFASLFKRERFGFPCKEFAEVLQGCEDAVSGEFRDSILLELEKLGIRGNYLHNLNEYINGLGGTNKMSIDILILTAVKDEFDVVFGLENDWNAKKDSRGYSYYTREITNNKGDKLTIALAHAVDMGEVNAANLATRLSAELNPKCLAMIGICAGWRKKVNLGDVIVADRAFSYDNGKLISFEKNEIQEDQLFSDIHTYNLNPIWKQNAQNMPPEWQKTIKTSRPIEYELQELWLLNAIDGFSNGHAVNPLSHDLRKKCCPDWTVVIKRLENKGLVKVGSNLQLTDMGKSELVKDSIYYPDGHPTHTSSINHVGPIATGKKVIEDRNAFPKISRSVRSVLGLEMESSAIGAVAELEQISKFIIVKAVSDYADEDKNDHFRKYSIEASYRFLISFLRDNYKG